MKYEYADYIWTFNLRWSLDLFLFRYIIKSHFTPIYGLCKRIDRRHKTMVIHGGVESLQYNKQMAGKIIFNIDVIMPNMRPCVVIELLSSSYCPRAVVIELLSSSCCHRAVVIELLSSSYCHRTNGLLKGATTYINSSLLSSRFVGQKESVPM